MKRAILIPLVVTLAVACGPTPEEVQVCRRSPELESSLVAVDASLESLDAMRPRLLQSSLSVLIGTLGVMAEVAPGSVVNQLRTVRDSYAELDAAFAAVSYDGRVAISDASVAEAIANIRGNETLNALERVRRFVAERCVAELGYAPPAGVVPGSTLPGPPIVVDPTEEPETGFEDGASATRSFGRLIGELAGLQLDDRQAECVGDALTEVASTLTDATDSLDELVEGVLARCTRPPESIPTTVG